MTIMPRRTHLPRLSCSPPVLARFTTVVTMAAVHTPDGLPITAIVAAIVGASVTLAVLLLATEIGPHLGRGTQAVVTRFMGLIVASMGMQFVLAGLKAFLSL